MKELSLGAQLDRAIKNYELSYKELGSVREKILLRTGPAPGSRFSLRERQILGGIARGLQNKEISNELGIAVRTVKFHISKILTKTGLTDRYALRRGLPHDDKHEISLSAVVPIRASGARSA